MAPRGGPSSFGRVFPTAADKSASDPEVEGSPPSVHELFSMAVRDELSLPRFAECLHEFHGVRLTNAAVKLLVSTDGSSGRISFVQFQRALQETSEDLDGKAGVPIVRTDQAFAIINDNNGAPVAPAPIESTAKITTDISADIFLKQMHKVAVSQAKGAFGSNPVVKSNRVSAGNPLVAVREPDRPSPRGVRLEPARDEASRQRELAQTATRMFVVGEIDRKEYLQFLSRCGVDCGPNSELSKLIISQEKVGEQSFTQIMRLLQREMARATGGA